MIRSFLWTMSNDDPKVAFENAYWDYTLTHDKPPASVYLLAQNESWTEKSFYKHYSSLSALENSFWERTVHEVIHLLEQDKDFPEYGSKEKYLAFLYTFVEHSLQYRSRFLARFPRQVSHCSAKRLRKMESVFKTFVEPIVCDSNCDCPEPLAEQWERVEAKVFWAHFVWMIHFNLDDESDAFGATDAFIEKTVHFVWELKGNSILDSAFDLGKFFMGRMSS